MIVFRNAGIIDMRAVTTFGVSSKESQSAIGHFGTGLKYAIAVLLRNNCKITIYCGTDSYEFGVEKARIRNDEFELVTMNGQPTAFITQLGRDWELWMAFRELYSNMLDEGGTCRKQDSVRGKIGETTIAVSGAAFEDVWNERHKVFLQGDALKVIDGLEVHNRPSKYLYYRGIRVMEFDKPTVFTYNILAQLELTEDRTVKHAWLMPQIISRLISRVPDESIIKKILVAEDSAESDFRFDGIYQPSDEFFTVMDKVKSHRNVNSSAREVYNQYRVVNKTELEPASLGYKDTQDLAQAVAVCASLGHDVTVYKVVPTRDLPDGTLGKVKSSEDVIYISTRAFEMGVGTLAGTLLEEYLHLKYDLPDCSRELQNFLLDALISTAMRESFREAA